VLAGEPALGAADGRQVEAVPDVAGEAEAAGVGDALAVAHEHVGPGAQPRAGAEHDRRLAEAEQAGQVGEPDPSRGRDLLDDLEPGQGDDDDCRHQALAVLIVGGVRAGDEAHPSEAGARLDRRSACA